MTESRFDKMRVQIASDLHQEFNKDDGLLPRADILILAGDIVPFYSKANLGEIYKRLRKKFETIIHVPGNHEYYSHRTPCVMKQLLEGAREVAAMYNVKILDNETMDIGDARLIGTTLWSHVPDEHAEIVAREVADYRYIYTERGSLTVQDTNELHKLATDFIERSVRDAQRDLKLPVVVTHHAPQKEETCALRYISTIRNSAYSTDLKHLYSGVHTWIFGHTHWPCDLIDKETGMHLVSNPKGYPGERVMFRRDLVVQIP